ncbi:FAD/NAD-binding domain-containing protein [Schizopora paradoxa]|uniref:FAD/NAD-binding domain-containing protein n=1 Tax=Schizopora paradoxa TaxID=27342 RepID=A0A0H2RI19_9AGAM|nr:FAD/NAD-binding domain-containing protein [Schizopora paradoxa]
MPGKTLRIAICGGGIGGLTLALVLQKFSKKDIKVDLYEAKDKFAEIGAGLNVWKRTWCIIQVLGLEKSMGEMAVHPPVEEPTPSFTFRRSDLPEGYEFHQIVSPYGTASMHRADMLKVLTDNLSEDIGTHFEKRLVSYVQDGSGIVTVSFADGTTAEADILVGADGLKSVTREVFYEHLANDAKGRDESEAQHLQKFIQPTWTGMYAYRTLVDSEKLLKIAPDNQAPKKAFLHFGKSGYVVAYPISKGRFVNFVSLVTHPEKEGSRLEGPLVKEVPVDELKRYFEGWEPHMQQLLSCVESCSRWTVCQNRDIPYYASGHVALLGDAAHAMAPSLGAGAGQAMEDAYVLGRLLAHDNVTVENVRNALDIYDIVRKPIASKVADLSRMCGNSYNFHYVPDSIKEAGVEVESPEGLKLLCDFIYSAWSFNWTGTPEDEWAQAEKMLNSAHGMMS